MALSRLRVVRPQLFDRLELGVVGDPGVVEVGKLLLLHLLHVDLEVDGPVVVVVVVLAVLVVVLVLFDLAVELQVVAGAGAVERGLDLLRQRARTEVVGVVADVVQRVVVVAVRTGGEQIDGDDVAGRCRAVDLMQRRARRPQAVHRPVDVLVADGRATGT